MEKRTKIKILGTERCRNIDTQYIYNNKNIIIIIIIVVIIIWEVWCRYFNVEINYNIWNLITEWYIKIVKEKVGGHTLIAYYTGFWL